MKRTDLFKEKLDLQRERICTLENELTKIELALRNAGFAEFQARNALEDAWREREPTPLERWYERQWAYFTGEKADG